METMTLIHTNTGTRTIGSDLTELSDSDLEAWFSQSGLEVEAVAHCDTASCEDCFSGRSRHKQSHHKQAA